MPSVSFHVIGERRSQAEVPSLPHVRAADPGPQGLVGRLRGAPSLLVQAPRGHAGQPGRIGPVTIPFEGLPALDPHDDGADEWRAPELGPDADLGDIVVVLLISTLVGLRDRLVHDGFDGAASLVEDLIEVADEYVVRLAPPDIFE